MKHVNLAYVNLAFVVMGFIVIAYTFSVTFFSSAEIRDQSIDIQALPFSQDQSPENAGGISSDRSITRRIPGGQPAQTRAPAEGRNSSSQIPARPASAGRAPTSQTPSSQTPSSVQRPRGTSRRPSVTAGRPPSRSSPGRSNSATAGQPAQSGSGFVVTPSEGVNREKRSAPQRSPSSPPVRGSLNR